MIDSCGEDRRENQNQNQQWEEVKQPNERREKVESSDTSCTDSISIFFIRWNEERKRNDKQRKTNV